jgi:hypothetical protein
MNTSKLLQNQRGDQVIVGCACGAGCGQLQFRLDAAADETLFLVHLWFHPAPRLRQRVQQAFDVLFGRAISADMLWDHPTAQATAHWLGTARARLSGKGSEVRAQLP